MSERQLKATTGTAKFALGIWAECQHLRTTDYRDLPRDEEFEERAAVALHVARVEDKAQILDNIAFWRSKVGREQIGTVGTHPYPRVGTRTYRRVSDMHPAALIFCEVDRHLARMGEGFMYWHLAYWHYVEEKQINHFRHESLENAEACKTAHRRILRTLAARLDVKWFETWPDKIAHQILSRLAS